jgi:hypothetical protein
MIFAIFTDRDHFDSVKALSDGIGSLLGTGADIDGKVVAAHSFLPSQISSLEGEGMTLKVIAKFLISVGVEIRLGGIDGELYVPTED